MSCGAPYWSVCHLRTWHQPRALQPAWLPTRPSTVVWWHACSGSERPRGGPLQGGTPPQACWVAFRILCSLHHLALFQAWLEVTMTACPSWEGAQPCRLPGWDKAACSGSEWGCGAEGAAQACRTGIWGSCCKPQDHCVNLSAGWHACIRGRTRLQSQLAKGGRKHSSDKHATREYTSMHSQQPLAQLAPIA